MNIDQIVSESKASQNKQELKSLLEILSKINPMVIVEIGVHKGYSLEVWKKMWPAAMGIGIDNELSSLDGEAVKGCIIIDADSHNLRTLTRVSNLFHAIDFLFIDGDHKYEGVKKDFEMYSPLVRPGGVIAFHDAVIKDNDSVDVYKFWEEIKDKDKSEIINLGGTGVGIIML